MLRTGEPKDIVLSKRSQTHNIAYLYALICKFIKTESRSAGGLGQEVGAGKL